MARKVGEIYQSTDGYYYKVLEINPNGAFVTRVDKPEEKPAEKKPAPKKTTTTTRKKKTEE